VPQPPFTSLDPTPRQDLTSFKMASKDDFEKGVAAPTLNKIRIVSPLTRWTLGQERDRLAVPWLALDSLPEACRPAPASKGRKADPSTSPTCRLPDADLAQRQEP
jgi:hypothetical protein